MFFKALDFPHINESSAVFCVCFITTITKQHSLCSFVGSEYLKDSLTLLNDWPLLQQKLHAKYEGKAGNTRSIIAFSETVVDVVFHLFFCYPAVFLVIGT